MKKTILFFSLFIAGILSNTLQAQSYDGTGDSKIFLGVTQIGVNSGVEAAYDFGLGDLVSMGSKVTLLFDNQQDSNSGDGFIEKFFTNTDMSIFLRFHLSIPLNLSEKIDPYTGLDFSLNSLGAHIGVKYNFSETLGIYGQISQGFSKLFFGETSTNKFANKTAISAGLTINL